MQSLANTKEFPASLGREINREMLVWCDNKKYARKVFVTAWTGFGFDGYENIEGKIDIHQFFNACEVDTEPKTRMMTAKECASLPHGTMFKCLSGSCEIVSTSFTISDGYKLVGHCLPEHHTDGEPSTWKWTPLTKEVTK